MLFGDSTYRQTRKQFLMETFPFWGGNSGAKIAVSLLGPLLLRRLAELTEPHHAAKLGAAGRESLLPQSYLLAGAARASAAGTAPEHLVCAGMELQGARLGWRVQGPP